MFKFYPIVVAILGFALPGGENPSVIAALGASGSPSYGGINPTKLEDGGKDNKVWGWKGWTAESIELHPDALGGRDAIQSTVEDDISKEKIARLTTILGFHTTEPSSEGMLAKICARDVMEGVPKYLRALYAALEDTTDPLDMVQRARTQLSSKKPQTLTYMMTGCRVQHYTLARILTAARNAIKLSNIGAVASMRAPSIHADVRSDLEHERLTMSERRVVIERQKEEAERLAQEPLQQEEEAAKRAERRRKANEDRRLDRQQNMRERENPHRIHGRDGPQSSKPIGHSQGLCYGSHDVCHKMAQEPVYLDAHVLQVLPQAPLGEVL
ncbi:hypothetical protein ACHAW5_002017 [Stephanodiscus triporus]|uniref:Uncharacterized protein n=1 Tax=Stephanodiscus triporus TaxID=2934178 RepID=A0ABD3MUT1_9STRA